MGNDVLACSAEAAGNSRFRNAICLESIVLDPTNPSTVTADVRVRFTAWEGSRGGGPSSSSRGRFCVFVC